MPGETPDNRIPNLEARIAEQDRVIADLNDMVVAQWRKIDSLDRRVGELRDEFEAAALARPDGPTGIGLLVGAGLVSVYMAEKKKAPAG